MYRIGNGSVLLALSCSLLLAGCLAGVNESSNDDAYGASAQRKLQIDDLRDRGPAPELENEVWLNVDAPLRISELRGKVVLLDFWTFG